MKQFLLALSLLVYSFSSQAQYSRADSLRGSLSEFRMFDVFYYDLNIKIDPFQRSISGYNDIHFTTEDTINKLQLDLFENMQVDSISYNGLKLAYQREFDAVWLFFEPFLPPGSHIISFYYKGKPTIAEKPPWDGGFVWKTDSAGLPWVTVACEGAGASLWWPNKDHLSDEPDSMRITGIVPEKLMCVANGVLEKIGNPEPGFQSYQWKISYPINNYNVTLNIANYTHLHDYYLTKDNDTLNLDYYVLPINKEKAAGHFMQVKDMLRCFEQYFGPYPFIIDGYKLVETPYWGMEHQSAIAYGNKYVNNEFGFDFIIVHESGHEYWGNSISTWDHGQMWVHESFTTYMESLLVECQQGYKQSIAYLKTQKPLIKNEMAIEQPIGVNFTGWNDADMYYKGTWMLHTIRNIIDDDQKWFDILRRLYNNYKLSIVNSEDIINFIDKEATHDLLPVFQQYLHEINPPVLQYYWKKANGDYKLFFRWHQVVEGFAMPIKFHSKGQTHTITPTNDWQSGKLKSKKNFEWATDLFYVIPEMVNEETH